ncbi:MAG: ribosome maturation factor RimP [Gemmatimonadota bacterium]
MAERSLEKALEEGVEALGFEFVELERTGSRTRPIFRLRIDLPDSTPGHGVTVDDCARVSRALETLLDKREFGDAYVLEVSSPGVDRPLVRRGDYERFAGQQIVLKGYAPFDDRGRRLEGELLGLVDEDGEERVRIRLADGAVLAIPREKIARAQLVFRWGD